MRYFRQALAMMREEKLFSGIYIVGTALAIAFTMVMAVVYYAKLANIEPEVNRSRTVYVRRLVKIAKEDTFGGIHTNYQPVSIDEWFQPLECAEIISSSINPSDITSEKCYLKCDNNKLLPVIQRMVDANFFKVYRFNFVYGRPFTQEECKHEGYGVGSVVPVIISRDIAEKAFGKNVNPVGKTLEFFYAVRVVGVIEPTSSIMDESFGQLFIASDQDTGHLAVVLKEGYTADDLQKEIDEIAHRLSVSSKEWNYYAFGTVIPHVQLKLSEDGGLHSWSDILKSLFPKVFVLLLVPALNLSGLVAARMRRRLAEMGVRKAFGATRRALLLQVISENFILTLFGGLLGLAFAWLMLYVFRSWLFFAIGRHASALPEPTIAGEMLFSPLIFITALLVCMVINLMAALVPAWLSLRNPIVESMNEKK
jgi:putative ABC transport system permease protein